MIKEIKSKPLFSFLLGNTSLFSQNERLIIGKTTGKLAITKKLAVRTFGFTNSLSGQVTLPGSDIDVEVGDNVSIDLWNISQGNPVSLYCKEIEFQQRTKGNSALKEKALVDHMEHGFYSFQATKAGTYLYYSPENYPFNLQAGMFGLIIVRSKEIDSLYYKPWNEILWCSNEIDTTWHSEDMMRITSDHTGEPINLPDYKPNYFLINGKKAIKNKGLQALEYKKDTVFLRLANSGLYRHEIVFPAEARLQLISGNEINIVNLPRGYKVKLHPGECFELLVFLENVADDEHVVYKFIDTNSNKCCNEANIPVFY
ncbi:copper oxidase [Flavobacterium hercynium]|uniref:Copper oxidase n=2 Tax=Flavobacterium hercynium TaxID=387094 RepID=A0A226H394_9FLAO|nr:copper oxidase [Flavobacterium hercynium]